jgi:hypothetical protein
MVSIPKTIIVNLHVNNDLFYDKSHQIKIESLSSQGFLLKK